MKKPFFKIRKFTRRHKVLIDGDVITVETKAGSFKIDAKDSWILDNFSGFSIHKGYAAARRSIDTECGIVVQTEVVHRLVIGLTTKFNRRKIMVDHINGDKSDNRGSNLRVATSSENTANSSFKTGVSGYRGVTVKKGQPNRPWRATIRGNNARELGSFKTPEEAARAYDAAAKLKWGPFAKLNFPME